MAIDWRRRRPMLGNIMGGLSGPAIKPIALRCVYQAAQAVKTPLIGIGGIATIDDVMEFLVAGASAVQIGTANFYDPTASVRIAAQLPETLATLGANTVGSIRRKVEAAMARKPRMPSDLEARLLQGSSLPIDFLLHDEVRHALRRGFWDALERSRRS